jgi:hypothetical protein
MTGGADPSDRVVAIGQIMKVDGVTAEVVGELRRRGVRSILLKGPSLGRWIYPDKAQRLYADTDLLVAPGDLPAVEAALSELGFVLAVPRHELDRPVPSANWYRPDGGAAVDVHVSITGIGVPHGAAWAVLGRDTESMTVGGIGVEVLSEPGRALHVALHAAQHGARERRPLQDLEVALGRLPDDLWRATAELAAELAATEALAAGLRLDPAGDALAGRLGLPAGGPVDVLLRRETAPPLALSIHWLSEMPGVWPRVRLVASKVFPPPADMRARARRLRRDHLPGVALEYLKNVLVLAVQVPPALRALRRARAAAREGRARRDSNPGA